MSSDHLPEGWTVAKISDITIKGEQRKPSSEETFTYVDIGSIDRDRKCISSPQYLAGNNAPSRARKVIKTGDVLVSLTRPNLNAVALVPDELDNQIASTGFEVVKPLSVDSRFVFALTKSKDFIDSISGVVQGALYPAAKSSDVQAYTFKLPALAEQKVIADKLDTLLAQVETTKARLERIPEILKTFRQSVLAAGVSGKLTEEWREKPAEWIEKQLNDVADNVVDCPHSTPKWSDVGKYCVKTTAFNPFYLDLSEQGFVSEEVFAERIQRLKPEPDDILYSREGTVGIACQIPPDTELCLGQRMVLIRAGSEINSKFLTIVLNSDKILSIVRQQTIGSTVPRVNMKDIRSYPIPVPTQNEQTEIVRRVEELFAFADRIEQKANAALERVNKLTQSILAKAFRGELTTDWRAANPELISGENSAKALLEKIKEEREALKPVKKSSVRKKS